MHDPVTYDPCLAWSGPSLPPPHCIARGSAHTTGFDPLIVIAINPRQTVKPSLTP
jgi:hypothetical protein